MTYSLSSVNTNINSVSIDLENPYYSKNYHNMLLIDKFYYLIHKTITNFILLKENNENSSINGGNINNFNLITSIQIEQKKILIIMENILKCMELTPNSETYNNLKYIFAIIADNTFCNLTKQNPVLCQIWDKSSLEIVLFNSTTGEYIIKNKLQKIIKKDEVPLEFISYGLLIAMESFNNQSFQKEKEWINFQLNQSVICTPQNNENNNTITLNTTEKYVTLSHQNKKKAYFSPLENSVLNMFFLIIIMGILFFFIKQLYWINIQNILPS